LFDLVVKNDPEYFTAFWTVPGYLGANPPPSLAAARLQHRAPVVKVIMSNEAASAGLTAPGFRNSADPNTAWQNFQAQYGGKPFPVAYQLKSVPQGKSLEGASILIQTGDGAGKAVSVGTLVKDMVTIQFSPVSGTLTDVTTLVKSGDEVQMDNSNFLAVQTYHRHQVPPTRDYYVFDQFRGPDGTPKYPQRPRMLGPMFTTAAAGALMTGKFAGKMIVVESLMDEDALPWQADWYRTKVRENLGPRFSDNYRLWVTEHALHGNPPYTGLTDFTRTVGYTGILQQALRDLSAWVERGVVPPAETNYKVTDGRMMIAATAASRKGVQPVVMLTANGGARADVKAGETITFAGVIEVPPGTGKVVAAEWDFDGSGAFAEKDASVVAAPKVQVTKTHTFSTPGTYFVVLRGMSQRSGDPTTPYARIRNIGRARVVVT
jgi:hypothetical protein